MENQIFDLCWRGRYVLDSRILELETYFGDHVLDFLKEGCASLLYYFLLVLVTNQPESRNNGDLFSPQHGVSLLNLEDRYIFNYITFFDNYHKSYCF